MALAPSQNAPQPTAISSSPEKQRIEFLDGARALAALFVLVHHEYLQVWPFATLNVLPSGITYMLTKWLQFGHFAVSIFIVLSGYCLMLPVARGDGYLRGGVWHFLLKRAKRILPPYYLSIVLSLILIFTCIGTEMNTHWDTSIPVTMKGVLLHLLLLQDIWRNGQINHVLWSVAVEWKIYFLFPVLVVLWRKYHPTRTMLLGLLLSFILFISLCLLKERVGIDLLGLTVQYIGLFLLGMWGATISFAKQDGYAKLRQCIPWAAIAVVLGVCIIGICYALPWKSVFYLFVFMDYLVGGMTTAMLIAASRQENNVFRTILSWKPLVIIGGFSYSLYLIHAPLIQVVWQYLIHPLQLGAVSTYILLVLIGAPIIIGFSYLFYLLCERPFINKKTV